MSQRWARCGSATPTDTVITVESLRSGLARAENPAGVLRGRVRPAAPPRRAPPSADLRHVGGVSISGTQLELLQSLQPAAPRQPARPVPPERPDRLRLGRAKAVVKFRGDMDDADSQFPADWVCAICLRGDWDKRGLSRLPRCSHVFHTLCIDKWFERASICPTCRQPV